VLETVGGVGSPVFTNVRVSTGHEPAPHN
jgi:hypothetical protein